MRDKVVTTILAVEATITDELVKMQITFKELTGADVDILIDCMIAFPSVNQTIKYLQLIQFGFWVCRQS